MDYKQKALDFLKDNSNIVFATSDNNVPDIRIFRVMKMEGETLYFSTSPMKSVYRQLKENPNVAVMASKGNVFVKCSGKVSFDVDEETAKWIYNNDYDLTRLYSSYDKLSYFKMDIERMDYFDLTPTPPVHKFYDLTNNTEGNGYVGERYSKD